jgi:hypothetical protein
VPEQQQHHGTEDEMGLSSAHEDGRPLARFTGTVDVQYDGDVPANWREVLEQHGGDVSAALNSVDITATAYITVGAVPQGGVFLQLNYTTPEQDEQIEADFEEFGSSDAGGDFHEVSLDSARARELAAALIAAADRAGVVAV